MEAELSCPLCGVDYSQERLPRILSACGHSFCEHCIEAKVTNDGHGKFFIACPEDNIRCQMTTKDPKILPINRSLLKIAQSAKAKTPHKDASFQLSKTTKEEEFQQDMEIHEFKEEAHHNLLEQSSYTKTHFECAQLQRKEQNQFLDEQNMCLLHQKPLEIVCVYDLQKVCAKCAIFGEHKGHDFKSLEQIEEEKNQFCQRLGSVFGLKKEIINRIENKTSKSQIISILNTKTQALSKQIKQKFKALIDAIEAQQARVLAKLESMNKKIERQIDNLYKIDSSLTSSYDDWEISAMQKLDCIKKGSFEEQLKLLIKVESFKEKNSFSEGQSLVDLMRAQQQNIISHSEALLGSLNLKVSDKIFQFIPNFVDVLDKSQQPETSQEEIHPLIQYSPQGSNQINLLEIQGSHETIQLPSRVTFQQSPIQSVKQIEIKPEQVKLIPFLEKKIFDEKSTKKPLERKTLTKRQFPRQKMKTQISQQIFLHTSRQISFASQTSIRSTKKKVKNIKVPEKYEKILESLSADTLQTLDLTNAELGDSVALQVCELLAGSKVKTVKLIRNKLTDEGLAKILPFMGDLVTLNLSQNVLTEKALDILISNRNLIPKVKNIVLSLNKIVERKDKKKLDGLRKFQITVSV